MQCTENSCHGTALSICFGVFPLCVLLLIEFNVGFTKVVPTYPVCAMFSCFYTTSCEAHSLRQIVNGVKKHLRERSITFFFSALAHTFVSIISALDSEVVSACRIVVTKERLLVLGDRVGRGVEREEGVLVVSINQGLPVVRVVEGVVLFEELHHKILDLVVDKVRTLGWGNDGCAHIESDWWRKVDPILF